MEEEQTKRYYKVEAGDTVTIHRKDAKNFTFYSLCFKKKDQNGKEIYLYKKVRFAGGADIPDKKQIRIWDFFEDGYVPAGSYDTIWNLVITNYEVLEDAIKEYQEKKNEDEGDIKIDPNADLPF